MGEISQENNVDFILNKIKEIYHEKNTLNRKFDIISTRFTSYTYLELYRYKNLREEKYKHNSLYSVKSIMGRDIIKINNYLFVFEMNNTINKIMGIGLIKSNLSKDQTINIYSNPEFNKYVYRSLYHVQLIEPSVINSYSVSSLNRTKNINIYCENIPEEIVDLMEDEIIPNCFFGKGHIKRGGGFTRYPVRFQQPEILEKLLKLFIIMNPNNFNTSIVKNKLINNPN